jgi:hypothetical protein
VKLIILIGVLLVLLSAGPIMFGIEKGLEDESWIAIGTAVYAGATVGVFIFLALAAHYAKQQVDYAKEQVSSFGRAMRLNLLDHLSTQWESELLREARRLANKSGKTKLAYDLGTYDLQNAKELYILSALANFFEEMGLLVNEGNLDTKEVAERFSPSILHYCELFAEDIKAKREEQRLRGEKEDHLIHFTRLRDKMASWRS